MDTSRPDDQTGGGGNIGEDGALFRLFLGVLMMFFAFGMAALMGANHAPLVLRATVFLPAWIGLLCLLQARARICVFLAPRGLRSTASGNVIIDDTHLRQSIEKRAVRIHLLTMTSASLLTLVLMVLSFVTPWRGFFAAE